MTTWQEDFVAQLREQELQPSDASQIPTMDTIRRASDEFISWARTLGDFNMFVLRQLQHVPNTLVASGLCPSWPGLLTMIPDTMNVFQGWDKFVEAVVRLRQQHGGADLDMQTTLDGILASR